MQGLMAPWARAIRARGGEIALGWKPVEIVVDDGRVRGAVAVDRTNLVREVRAPVVISTYPVWENFDADRRAPLPARVRRGRRARSSAHRADLIGWQAGLRRLPTMRATGRAGASCRLEPPPPRRRARLPRRLPDHVDDEPPRRAARQAPPVAASWCAGSAARRPPAAVDRGARASSTRRSRYLRAFYADLDDVPRVERRTSTSTAPQATSWAWAPLERPRAHRAGHRRAPPRRLDDRGARGAWSTSPRGPGARPRSRRRRFSSAAPLPPAVCSVRANDGRRLLAAIARCGRQRPCYWVPLRLAAQ